MRRIALVAALTLMPAKLAACSSQSSGDTSSPGTPGQATAAADPGANLDALVAAVRNVATSEETTLTDYDAYSRKWNRLAREGDFGKYLPSAAFDVAIDRTTRYGYCVVAGNPSTNTWVLWDSTNAGPNGAQQFTSEVEAKNGCSLPHPTPFSQTVWRSSAPPSAAPAASSSSDGSEEQPGPSGEDGLTFPDLCDRVSLATMTELAGVSVELLKPDIDGCVFGTAGDSGDYPSNPNVILFELPEDPRLSCQDQLDGAESSGTWQRQSELAAAGEPGRVLTRVDSDGYGTRTDVCTNPGVLDITVMRSDRLVDTATLKQLETQLVTLLGRARTS